MDDKDGGFLFGGIDGVLKGGAAIIPGKIGSALNLNGIMAFIWTSVIITLMCVEMALHSLCG